MSTASTLIGIDLLREGRTRGTREAERQIRCFRLIPSRGSSRLTDHGSAKWAPAMRSGSWTLQNRSFNGARGTTIVLLITAASAQAGRVLYVDPNAPGPPDGSSWTQAYHDLQPVLEMAATDLSVTEIRVAQGHYLPTEDPAGKTASFVLRNGLALRGSFAGYGAPNPNSRFSRTDRFHAERRLARQRRGPAFQQLLL
jgi:hypothetical protein